MTRRAPWSPGATARSLLLLLGSIAFTPLASAASSFDGELPNPLHVGSPVSVKWTTDEAPVKVTLNNGIGYQLYDVICGVWIRNDMDQACTTSSTSKSWTPGDDLPAGLYSLKITGNNGDAATSNTFNLVKTPGSNGGSSSDSSSSTTGDPSSTTDSSSSATMTTTAPDGSRTTITESVPGATGGADGSTGSSSGGNGGDGGLSTGAKAGIGVGAAIGGLAMMGAIGFFLFRLGKKAAARKDANKKDEETADATPDEFQKAELAGDTGHAGGGGDDKKDEVAELNAPDVIHEVPDHKARIPATGKNEFVAELDATGGSFLMPKTSRPSSAAPSVPSVVISPATERRQSTMDHDNLERSGTPDRPVSPVSALGDDDHDEANAGRTDSNTSESALARNNPSSPQTYETPDDIGQSKSK